MEKVNQAAKVGGRVSLDVTVPFATGGPRLRRAM
jgi:hypothetical protein